VPTPILAGAEPYSFRGGPIGVVVLHGFTGNPQSMRSLAQSLAKAGCSVELPLLPGHGSSVEDMISTRWSDWSAAVDETYRDLAGRCATVFIAGLSMGGSLAIWLAERHHDIAGIVVVNPLVDPPHANFRDMLRGMLAEGAVSVPGIGSDVAMQTAAEPAYDATPLEPMLSMFEGVDEVASRLGEVRCPVLLFSSRVDHVVPPESGDLLAAGVAGPLERSFHVATLDYDAGQIEAGSLEFVNKLGASK
jgi:carboxylesterase